MPLVGKSEKLSSFHKFTAPISSFSTLKQHNNFILEFEDGLSFSIEINEIQTISSNHPINLGTTNPLQNIQAELDNPIQVLKGRVESLHSSQVLFVQTNSGIEGFIKTQTAQYYLEKDSYSTHDSVTEYLFYNAKDISDKTIHCLINEQEKINVQHLNRKSLSNTCLNIDIAVAVDYNYFQSYNNDITEVIARTIVVMNASTYDYSSVFDNEIIFNITEHFISTCYECDPWGNQNDALALIDEFGLWAEDGGFASVYDLGQLWTGRDLEVDENSNTIGYANKGALCSDKRYHILEDFSETLWKLRLLESHEIGHNLNASHDGYTENTIMSPSLSNTETWSNQSISAINAFVNGTTCIDACHIHTCEDITGLSIDNFTSSVLDISWEIIDSTRIILFEEDRDEILLDTIVFDDHITIQYSFSNCENYSIKLHSICDGINSNVTSLLMGSPEELFADFVNITTTECLPGNTAQYNIELVIEHNGIQGEAFYVDILGATKVFYFENSPQTVYIYSSELPNNQDQFPIQLFTILQSKLYCLDNFIFTEVPNPTCDLFVHETFDNCELPFNWQTTSDNSSYFPFSYSWKFDNNSRKILNYGKGNNATQEKTIDGSCMAYFDDDIDSNVEFTGEVIMLTDLYDLSDFTNVEMSFSYIFHDFADVKNSNNSYFAVELWNGQEWINVLYDNQVLCPWSDVWNAQCIKLFTINLDQYAHSTFQCRFIYSDGNQGDWTGMIALDNFLLSGDRILTHGCTSITATNYDPSANIDDGSCYSCVNAVMDGEETGIDCGGPDCLPCLVPCEEEDLYISEINTDMTFSNINKLFVSAIITKYDVNLQPASFVALDQGFEVQKGATLDVNITGCKE